MYLQVPGNHTIFPLVKKNVDEIIANSAHTDKWGIKYIVKFGLEDSPDGFTMSTRNQFSYDMFTDWCWDKLHEYQYWPVDDLFHRPKALKQSSATKLEFKPQ